MVNRWVGGWGVWVCGCVGSNEQLAQATQQHVVMQQPPAPQHLAQDAATSPPTQQQHHQQQLLQPPAQPPSRHIGAASMTHLAWSTQSSGFLSSGSGIISGGLKGGVNLASSSRLPESFTSPSTSTL
jgi:hypothetical protein